MSSFVVKVRSIPVEITQTVPFMHLTRSDIFFMLCGFLHREPCRFISVEEIHAIMVDALSVKLSAMERAKYQLDATFWVRLRTQNDLSTRPCVCGVAKFYVFTRAEMKTYDSTARSATAKRILGEAQESFSEAVAELLPVIGYGPAKKLFRRTSLVLSSEVIGGRKERATIKRVGGVAYRTFVLKQGSYSTSLRVMAEQPWQTFSLPGGAPEMLAGLRAVRRELVVTISGVPKFVTAASLLAGVSGDAVLSGLLTGAAVNFARSSALTQRQSFQLVLETEAKADELCKNHVLRIADDSGKMQSLRLYHHVHDHDTDWQGRSSDVSRMVKHLWVTYPEVVNQSRPCVAIQVWEDGVATSLAHLVVGLARLVGLTFSPFGRLYTFRGSDSDSSMMALLLAQVCAMVTPRGRLGAFLYVLDHAMAFDRLSVRAGNHGFRNPFVEIECADQGWRFFGPARTLETLFRDAMAMFEVFRRIAGSGILLEDMTKTSLKKIGRAIKRSFGHGVVDMPVPLRFTRHDEWGCASNVRALEFWQVAFSCVPSMSDLGKTVLLNMRSILPLRTDGLISLVGLVMPNVKFRMTDEKGVEIPFDDATLLSCGVVSPGSRVFLQLRTVISMPTVVLCPPLLHCLITIVGCVLQELEGTLVAGGVVFDESTVGKSKVELCDLLARVKQMVLGRGYIVHSYATLSGMTPIFARWLELVGSITHPALHHLPVLVTALLRTRSSNDLTLKSDPFRYSTYVLSIFLVPAIICSEIAELRRRCKTPTFATYLQFRGGEGGLLPGGSDALESFFLPLCNVPSLVLDGGDEAVSENADPAGARLAQLRGRKFEAIKVASLCCGLPNALLQLARLTEQPVLLYHLDEAYMERTLKKTKAMVRAGNQRTAVMDAVAAHDQKDAEDEIRSALRVSHRWEGEGLGVVVIGLCYFKKLTIAAWNIIEALERCVRERIGLDQHMQFAVDGKFLVGVSIRLGSVTNARVCLCACGNPLHKAQLECDLVWRPFTTQLFAVLCKSKPVPATSAATDGADLVEQLVTDALADGRLKEQRRVRAERGAAVLAKLHSLNFVGAELTARMLADFFKSQGAHVFDGQPWPRTMEAQIDFVHSRLNHDFYHRGAFENRQSKRR